MDYLGVIWSCIKTHLYPVGSFAICNLYLCFYGICVLIFYFHCHFSTVLVRLLRVYLIAINQSCHRRSFQPVSKLCTKETKPNKTKQSCSSTLKNAVTEINKLEAGV